jgi:hypothetical protein
MPFIGKQPEVGAYSKLDAITTSATATYNLTLDSGAYYPTSANHLLVSLNGVMQAPQDSFTVSGSTIVFASTLASTDSIDFIMALGDVLDIGTPSDGTVTSAKIVSGAVTSAKLDTNIAISGNLTTGNTSIVTGGRFISSQTSNDPWLKGVNSSNTETSYIKKDGQIYSAFGISVGGTGAANTLDDYEEGAFTPYFAGSGSNPTVSYALQLGTYVKIGKLVYVNVSVIASGTPSSGGGDLIIAGLPFTSKSGVQQAGSMAFANNITFGNSGTQGYCNIEGGVSYLNINSQELSGTSSMQRVPTSGIQNSAPRIVCSICYETT